MRCATVLCLVLLAGSFAASACTRSGFTGPPDAASEAGPGDSAATAADAAAADAAEPPRGDFNRDGCIDCADATLLQHQLDIELYDPTFDLNDDGQLDLGDISLLANRMGDGCTDPILADLEVWGDGFDPHIGMTMHNVLSYIRVDREDVPFSFAIEGFTTLQVKEALLVWDELHLLSSFLDVNGDGSCGRDDLAWLNDFSTSGCHTKVYLNPSAGELHQACSRFDITADFTGDGCVDEADFEIFEAEFQTGGGPDSVADFDGDGSVTTIDFSVFLRNWQLGCEDADGGMPDASAIFEGGLPDGQGLSDAPVARDGGVVEASVADFGAIDVSRTDSPFTLADVAEVDAIASAADAALTDAGDLSDLVWVQIPGGNFEMGCVTQDPSCTVAEVPPHRVELAAFEITRTPITQGQYLSRTGGNPSAFAACGPLCPVEQVTWDEAQAFCQNIGGRLPTEAEWEYAARANSSTIWACGDEESCVDAIAWYEQNSNSQTQPVGEKAPNAFGLYDMFGNVFEWLEDCWHGNYTGAPADGSAWLGDGGGDCNFRVQRGGYWGTSHPAFLRASIRNHTNPAFAYDRHGFRCAR